MIARLDRYIFASILTVFFAVVALVISLLVLEHMPRLFEISRHAGQPMLVIGRTMIGLLPEYAGIGIIVGLYMAFATTIRKLSLRGELEAIEALGIGPARWMRMMSLFALIGAACLFLNEGWFAPLGERRVAQISEQLKKGEFGIQLRAREFHDLGSGRTLFFDALTPASNEMRGIYISEGENTYTASRGRILLGPSGGVSVRLFKGQVIDHRRDGAAAFEEMGFNSRGAEAEIGAKHSTSAKSFDALWQSDAVKDHSAAYARLLTVALALFTPCFAFYCARPPQRSNSAIGFLVGFCLMIALLKSVGLAKAGMFLTPLSASLGLLLCWIGVLIGLIHLRAKFGVGAIDLWFSDVSKRLMRLSSRRFVARG